MTNYIDPTIVKPGDVIEYRHKDWPEGDFVRATVRDTGERWWAGYSTLRSVVDGGVNPGWLDGILVILSHTPAPRALPTKVGTVIDATVTHNDESVWTRLMLDADGDWISARKVGGYFPALSHEHLGSDWVLVVDGEGE